MKQIYLTYKNDFVIRTPKRGKLHMVKAKTCEVCAKLYDIIEAKAMGLNVCSFQCEKALDQSFDIPIDVSDLDDMTYELAQEPDWS